MDATANSQVSVCQVDTFGAPADSSFLIAPLSLAPALFAPPPTTTPLFTISLSEKRPRSCHKCAKELTIPQCLRQGSVTKLEARSLSRLLLAQLARDPAVTLAAVSYRAVSRDMRCFSECKSQKCMHVCTWAHMYK